MKTFLAIALTFMLSGFCGYGWGKYRADRWYAQNWHPNLRLSDLVYPNGSSTLAVGTTMLYKIDHADNTAIVFCHPETKGTRVFINYSDGLAADVHDAMFCNGKRWMWLEAPLGAPKKK